MPKLLGLDIGDKRVGIAISDESATIARPLEIIDRGQKNPFKRIAALVAEHGIAGIVAGKPLNADGSAGAQAVKTAAFCRTLASLLSVPIHQQDERWSSGEAGAIAKINRHKDARRTRDDAVAAAIILQRHLDEKHQADC
jgi:putative Holliday junction resolvase